MAQTPDDKPFYLNPNVSPRARARDLIVRMTLAEKVASMMDESQAVERLGIPAFKWSHDLSSANSEGTVFPAMIGLAASWNVALAQRVAATLSDEIRSQYNAASQNANPAPVRLTFWGPTISLLHDPRWRQRADTFGEDPLLVSLMGVAFVKGLQGDDPRYLKTAVCAPFLGMISGTEASDPSAADDDPTAQNEPNSLTSASPVEVGPRDLLTTYLPPFKAAVRDGAAAGIMAAGTRLNGRSSSADPLLLFETLRRHWGFRGFVASSQDAIRDVYLQERIKPESAAAMAVRAGCDLNWGRTYEYLLSAVGNGLLRERDIDRAVINLFEIRFRLGLFDPPEQVPFSRVPSDAAGSPTGQALALEAARQSIVLLRNEDALLPLKKDLPSLAVIGPYADWEGFPLSDDHPSDPGFISVHKGIRGLASPATNVMFSAGSRIFEADHQALSDAVQKAAEAEVAVLVLGVPSDAANAMELSLPACQAELLRAVIAVGKPVVLILMTGGMLSGFGESGLATAVVQAWYPGQLGGRAVAEVLFGDVNPGGKLPVTFYQSVAQLPPFDDYAMAGRTYRYFAGDVLYPFGFGLSYTTFVYDQFRLSFDRMESPQALQVTVKVRNTGDRAGDEVVQLYLKDEAATESVPLHTLVGFERIHLAPGGERQVEFSVPPKAFALINHEGYWMIEPGKFSLFVGGGQPGTPGGLTVGFDVLGSPIFLED